MKKKNIIEDKLQIVFFILFVITILGWLIWSIYGAFWLPVKDNSKTIRFEVTGISNSENASSLVQLHWQCMQFCVKEYGNYGMSTSDCWKECATLGKEACNGK
jgi:hypothetical protein